MASVTQTPRQAEDNYRLLISWMYSKVEFLGLPSLKDERPLRLEDIYVPLSLKRSHEPNAERVYVPAVLEQYPQIVVLGDPGSGKSTLVKVLAYQFGRIEPAPLARRLGPHVPIPIILRDYDVSQWRTWRDMLAAFIQQLPSDRPPEVSGDWLVGILQEGRGILLLDGLDEVGSVEARRHLRDRIILPMLDETGPNLVVLTSRIVGYEEVPFDSQISLRVVEPSGEATLRRIQRCYVAPFNQSEIKEFVTHWYAVRETEERLRKSAVASLLDAIFGNRQIGALASNPGLLTLMALVHRVTATLPSGRVKLYDKIVEAYLETIDIHRKLPQFDATLEQMKRWMARVGWEMQLRRDRKGVALRATRGEILQWLTGAISSDRPSGKEATAERFLNHIASRSGLLVEVSPSHFEFAHLSIQEYFVAWYLRGLILRFDDLSRQCIIHLSEEWWHESLILLFSMLSEFPGAGDELVEKIASQVDRGNVAAGQFFFQLLAEERNGLGRGNEIAANVAVEVGLTVPVLPLEQASEERYQSFIKPALGRSLEAGPSQQSGTFIYGWWRIVVLKEQGWSAALERYVGRWSEAPWTEAQMHGIVEWGGPSLALFQWLLERAPFEAWNGGGFRWLGLLLRGERSPRSRALAEAVAADLCRFILFRRSHPYYPVDSPAESDLRDAPPSLARSVALAALGDEVEVEALRSSLTRDNDWTTLLRLAALLAAGAGTTELCHRYLTLRERLADGSRFGLPPYLADQDCATLSLFFDRSDPLNPGDFAPSSPHYARMTMPVRELLKVSR